MHGGCVGTHGMVEDPSRSTAQAAENKGAPPAGARVWLGQLAAPLFNVANAARAGQYS